MKGGRGPAGLIVSTVGGGARTGQSRDATASPTRSAQASESASGAVPEAILDAFLP